MAGDGETVGQQRLRVPLVLFDALHPGLPLLIGLGFADAPSLSLNFLKAHAQQVLRA